MYTCARAKCEKQLDIGQRITKTRHIIFLISAQNIDCGYSLEPPRRGGSNGYPQSMF